VAVRPSTRRISRAASGSPTRAAIVRTVRSPTIIAAMSGVSGNGQKELADVLGGQIRATGGRVAVQGEPYRGTRAQSRRHRVRFIPDHRRAGRARGSAHR
jgi:ABC-type uncharacterized transport system ATPase subunit